MITLTINVNDISSVLQLFDTVQVRRFSGSGSPGPPINIADYTTVSGIDQINSRTNVSNILLSSSYSSYYFVDPDGSGSDWYTSRYYNSSTLSSSGWADPIQGETGDLYHDPMYPPEVSYGTADQRVADRIRLYLGDPIRLERMDGEEDDSGFHYDYRVFELEEKGWPASVNMYGQQYTSINDPVVNGYRFLKFQTAIDNTVVTLSGINYAVDVWYYTFRHSDRQIMDAYDNCPPPEGLSVAQTTADIYMLQTAYDLITSEFWEDLNEDGAIIKDDKDSYDPSPGLKHRSEMLDKLKKRLDDAIKVVRLLGTGGVRID